MSVCIPHEKIMYVSGVIPLLSFMSTICGIEIITMEEAAKIIKRTQNVK